MKAIILAAGLLAIGSVTVAAKAPKTSSGAAAIERGRVVYEYHCATCHGAGPQMPGTAALAVKYKGKNIPAVLKERRDLTPEAIKYFTRNGVNMMPHFRKAEIRDQELDDMTAYLLSRKGKK